MCLLFVRAVPLFFAFDRINYKRCAPLYYEDCLSLADKFPMLYESFNNGGFCCYTNLTKREWHSNGSSIRKKQYNKPAKSQLGVIGFPRRKEAVCKWNIIKHEKSRYTEFMYRHCGLDADDEYSTHHQFSPSTTKRDQETVQQMKDYILERGNPFDMSQNSIVNICTGVQLDSETSEFFQNCIEIGECEYKKFKTDRLEKKTQKLLDTIPKVRKAKKKIQGSRFYDLKKETVTLDLLRSIY